MNEENLKESFVELCSQIFVTSDGFQFPFDSIRHNDDFSEIYASKEWSILENKMSNLLELINSDNSLIDKDIETELWKLI
jgi:hypothetical protein